MGLEVKAKYDYNSGHEDDLSFNAGQIIQVTEEVDDEWYNGEFNDRGQLRRGMFPRNFVSIINRESTATVTSFANL
jgi:myosin tail region-interacting protein MTI1